MPASLGAPSLRGRGMSLIEILVGLAIALTAMLIVFQVLAASGERRRTTTSGSDAQTAGTLALYQLERDIKLAGFGFGKVPYSPKPGGVAGCSVAAHNSTLAAADFTFPLTPVQIVKDTVNVGAADKIYVLYGNSDNFVTSRQFNGSTNTSKSLVRRDLFVPGDIVLVTNDGTSAAGGVCALVEITANNNIDSVTVDHVQSAAYTSSLSGTAIAATAKMNAGATLVAASGWVYNLGAAPSRNLWQVSPAGGARPNMLVWNNTLSSDTQQQVSEGIVNLQAQYGVDDGAGAAGAAAVPPAVAGDGIISPTEWSSANPTDSSRVIAMRFALLARSQQVEKAAVTTVAPTWSGGTFTMFNVDGSSGATPPTSWSANDWRNYRYRVYEAIVPLRNMIWGNSP